MCTILAKIEFRLFVPGLAPMGRLCSSRPGPGPLEGNSEPLPPQPPAAPPGTFVLGACLWGARAPMWSSDQMPFERVHCQERQGEGPGVVSLAVTVPINDGFNERTSGRPQKGVLRGCGGPGSCCRKRGPGRGRASYS